MDKIKGIYGEVFGLISQIPDPKNTPYLKDSTINRYHQIIDTATNTLGEDLSRFKVSTDVRENYGNEGFSPEWLWDSIIVRSQIGSFISYLEQKYSLKELHSSRDNKPGIVLINQNTIAVTINQTRENLIQTAKTDEEKNKLSELKEELNKPNKNWEKVKPILSWILNFSEKLFLEVLPIILKTYGLQN